LNALQKEGEKINSKFLFAKFIWKDFDDYSNEKLHSKLIN
jgi:hypothetical protein